MGLKSNWDGAHVRLRRLYDERLPEGMTQKEFGSRFGIGSQSMVAQYLGGTRPLNYEAAARFARGLGCTIYDISPEMADSLKEEILPFLGKALRRAAVLAFFSTLPALFPTPADASQGTVRTGIFVQCTDQLCIMVSRMLRRIRAWLAPSRKPYKSLTALSFST